MLTDSCYQSVSVVRCNRFPPEKECLLKCKSLPNIKCEEEKKIGGGINEPIQLQDKWQLSSWSWIKYSPLKWKTARSLQTHIHNRYWDVGTCCRIYKELSCVKNVWDKFHDDGRKWIWINREYISHVYRSDALLFIKCDVAFIISG